MSQSIRWQGDIGIDDEEECARRVKNACFISLTESSITFVFHDADARKIAESIAENANGVILGMVVDKNDFQIIRD